MTSFYQKSLALVASVLIVSVSMGELITVPSDNTVSVSLLA